MFQSNLSIWDCGLYNMLYAFCQWPSQMCASVGRSLDNDNNNTIGLFSAFHGPQRRFREQTCKVVVVENHVTHRLSSSFHSTLTKTLSSPIAPAEKNVWRRHWPEITYVRSNPETWFLVWTCLLTSSLTREIWAPNPSLVGRYWRKFFHQGKIMSLLQLICY